MIWKKPKLTSLMSIHSTNYIDLCIIQVIIPVTLETNAQLISQTTQTEPLITIERMRLYRELQLLPQPMPTSSPENSSERSLSTLMKTSSTFSKEKVWPQPSTNSKRLTENSLQSRCARPPLPWNLPRRQVHQKSNSQNDTKNIPQFSLKKKPTIFPLLDHVIMLSTLMTPLSQKWGRSAPSPQENKRQWKTSWKKIFI